MSRGVASAIGCAGPTPNQVLPPGQMSKTTESSPSMTPKTDKNGTLGQFTQYEGQHCKPVFSMHNLLEGETRPQLVI